jgi:hypothetical protein
LSENEKIRKRRRRSSKNVDDKCNWFGGKVLLFLILSGEKKKQFKEKRKESK